MAAQKTKSVYFCSECGAQSSTWIGKCPTCGAWNSYNQEIIQRDDSAFKDVLKKHSKATPQLLDDIESIEQERILFRDSELNRVLGGGLVKGSVVLVAGEPGIGKSTLLLQVALKCEDKKILYVSGEESLAQIKLRAQRVDDTLNNNCYFLADTSVENILANAKELEPQIMIIDSIQTITTSAIDSFAGSISQIRECAAYLQQYAKTNNVALFLVGHITKDGSIAGPKILEHIVDTVLQFEGDTHYGFRMLRTIKNRFGSTSELGIYEMFSSGLKEVSNPSEILLSVKDNDVSGSAIAVTLEGSRPFLIETQSLVASSNYSSAQRNSTGFDSRRLSMLLAVLEKRGEFPLNNKDVFINIAGGIKTSDPALDLAVCMGIISSLEDMNINTKYCFSAEVGLSGELRGVSRIDSRIAEAQKLGFEKIFIAKYNAKGINLKDYDIQVMECSSVEETLKKL